jgi:hypothetical protein
MIQVIVTVSTTLTQTTVIHTEGTPDENAEAIVSSSVSAKTSQNISTDVSLTTTQGSYPTQNLLSVNSSLTADLSADNLQYLPQVLIQYYRGDPGDQNGLAKGLEKKLSSFLQLRTSTGPKIQTGNFERNYEQTRPEECYYGFEEIFINFEQEFSSETEVGIAVTGFEVGVEDIELDVWVYGVNKTGFYVTVSC